MSHKGRIQDMETTSIETVSATPAPTPKKRWQEQRKQEERGSSSNLKTIQKSEATILPAAAVETKPEILMRDTQAEEQALPTASTSAKIPQTSDKTPKKKI